MSSFAPTSINIVDNDQYTLVQGLDLDGETAKLLAPQRPLAERFESLIRCTLTPTPTNGIAASIGSDVPGLLGELATNIPLCARPQ